ncbi:MAG: S46 family peptidase [Flavobacteriaceae bacterium]
MKKVLILLLLVLFIVPVKANEGMWFLMHIERLNYVDMQKMGLQLTPEEIYSVNNNSLKDAIVQFGGGCTAEIISKNGLVLTNHHCGYGQIAELSTEENDYLTNGFWAKNYGEELKPANLSVRFFVRMDDVTERILALVNDEMSELEREKVVNQEIAKIQKENNEGGKYTVSVKSFYSGNEYYYFVYQDYTDVRFVGAPPSSIGKFGGDTDNWEWPRHTGDFSLFRVYGDKEGNPATYSKDNVPLNVDYHLPVSTKGFQEDDFAMILGYPGRTNRWMPASGIDQNVNYAYPAWVEGSKTAMDAMKPHMDANQKVKLDYASKYAGIANYWKNRQGMIDALKQHKTAESKRKFEDDFTRWAKVGYNPYTSSNSDSDSEDDSNSNTETSSSLIKTVGTKNVKKFEKKTEYVDVMKVINEYFSNTNRKSSDDNYLISVLRGSNLILLPNRFNNLVNTIVNEESIPEEAFQQKIQPEIDQYFDGLFMPLEHDVLIETVSLYALNASNPVPSLEEAKLNYKMGGPSIKDYLKELLNTSVLSSKENFEKFAKNPNEEAYKNDPLVKLSQELLTEYRFKSEELKELEDQYQKAYRLMIKGMREMNPDEVYYPDANSTLRLSYGKVRALPLGNKKNDAKKNYYTTLKGTVAKYQPGDDEFDMPQKLIDLYNAKDFGPYADKAGHMPVNFLTDHDITGGNSGSPVLNGKGELIGLAFDGNIEAMAGDVIFDDELQRAINVDVRYILFIIDKYAGAKHLVDEMTIKK